MTEKYKEVVPYIYLLLLVAKEVIVSLVVCSLFAAINLVLNALGLELPIFRPHVHQRLPSVPLSIAPFWNNLRNENI